MSKETKNWEELYCERMAKVLEEQFPKGEKCKCGDRLRARSHALVLNAWANIYAKDAVQAERQAEREEIIEDIAKIFETTKLDNSAKAIRKWKAKN